MMAVRSAYRRPLLALLVLVAGSMAFGMGAAGAANHNHPRRGYSRRTRHRTPTPSPTPSPTPTPSPYPLVLLSGGVGLITGAAGANAAVLDTTEIYDVHSGRFFPGPDMMSRRDLHRAVGLPNGEVLLVGGVDAILVPFIALSGSSAPWILNSNELFDPQAGLFRAAGKMAVARDNCSATMLHDGTVLIAGGGVAGAELYDPATGKYAKTGA